MLLNLSQSPLFSIPNSLIHNKNNKETVEITIIIGHKRSELHRNKKTKGQSLYFYKSPHHQCHFFSQKLVKCLQSPTIKGAHSTQKDSSSYVWPSNILPSISSYFHLLKQNILTFSSCSHQSQSVSSPNQKCHWWWWRLQNHNSFMLELSKYLSDASTQYRCLALGVLVVSK